MRFPLLFGAVVGTLICVSCGGGNSTPTGPTSPPTNTVPPPTSDPNMPVRYYFETADGQPSATIAVGANILLLQGVERANGSRAVGNAFAANCSNRSSNAAVVTVDDGVVMGCPGTRSSTCLYAFGKAPGSATLTCHDLQGRAIPSTPFQVTVQ